MEIPLNARVECTDGICGRSVYVLIDPVFDRVTHLVVKLDASPNNEYIVPVDLISRTIVGTIMLTCNKSDVLKMDPFIKTTFIQETVPDRNFKYPGGFYGGESYYYLPYVTSEPALKVPEEHLQIPVGELAIKRGARVEATDGYVGAVSEFVVNPNTNRITHLVLREGHLWGKRDVIVPLSAMGEIRDNTVFLNIDKLQMELLPSFLVNRRWA
jgi:sporulation protein YlmC with PRC-barrel domain